MTDMNNIINNNNGEPIRGRVALSVTPPTTPVGYVPPAELPTINIPVNDTLIPSSEVEESVAPIEWETGALPAQEVEKQPVQNTSLDNAIQQASSIGGAITPAPLVSSQAELALKTLQDLKGQGSDERYYNYQLNRALAQQGFGSDMAKRYDIPTALKEGIGLQALGSNALNSAKSLGTGIAATGAILPKALQYSANIPMSTDDYNFINEIVQQTGDFLRYADKGQKASTLTELALTGNLLPAQDIEKIVETGNYGAIVPTMINNWYRDPVQGSIDLIGMIPALGGIGAAIRGVTKAGKVGSKAGRVANMATKATAINNPSKAAKTVYDVANASASQALTKVRNVGEQLKNFSVKELTQAIKSINEGNPVAGRIAQAKEALRAFQKEWKTVLENYAPYSIEMTDNDFAATQRVARLMNMSFDKVRKEIALAKDLANSEINSLKKTLYQDAKLKPEDIKSVSKISGERLGEVIDRFKFNIPESVQEILNNLKSKEYFVVDSDKLKATGFTRNGVTGLKAIKNANGSLDIGRMLRSAMHEEVHNTLSKVAKNPELYRAKLNSLFDDLSSFYNKIKGSSSLSLEQVKKSIMNSTREDLIKASKNKTKDPHSYMTNAEETVARMVGAFTEQGLRDLDNKLYNNIKPSKTIRDFFKDESNVNSKVLDLYDESLRMAEKGDIFPLTQADAQGASSIRDALAYQEGLADVRIAGKASSRIAGDAPYEEVAKALKNNAKWLSKKAGEITETISKEAVKANGEELEKGLSKGNLKYVNPDDFNTTKDLEKLQYSDVKDATHTMPVNQDLTKNLAKYNEYFRDANPFAKGTALAEGYAIAKGVKLGSGRYLYGNAITGAANMLLNSGLDLPLDIADALKSKNSLARSLGIHREMILPETKTYTPVGKAFAMTNKPVSSMLSGIDATMQNFFGEVAAHNNLRRQGIPFNKRVNKVLELTTQDEQKLGDIINDVRRVALIQSGDSIVPRQLRGLTALTTGDFWRWHEEAARSAGHMIKKRPYLSGLILNRLMGDVAFDREMQHRYNIKADMDKPNVHLKMDYRDGQFKEVSSEIVPMMNTLKFTTEVADALAGKGKISEALGQVSPWTTTILNASMGIDRYGNPIKREGVTVDYKTKKRYLNGQELKGVQGDELISAIINTFSVYPSLYNKTLAPTAAMLKGENFYQPYGSSIFGSFKPDNPMVPNETSLMFSGNPMRVTTPQNNLDSYAGLFETRYYDENRPDHPAALRGLIKQDLRNKGRLLQEYNRYINETTGGGF